MRQPLRLVLLVVVLLAGGCSSLLFYPVPGLPLTPARAGLAFRDLDLEAADGTRLHAWWLPAKAGQAVKGTVLYLHGNGGNLAWHLGGSWWLPEQGWQVLMLDYRGYGLSGGSPSLPEVYQDVQAAFAWLEQAPEVQGRPLALLGQSMGGALAVHYLAAHEGDRTRLSALVLDGVPASYRAVARHALGSGWLTWPLRVPLSWLVPDGDSAIRAMPKLKGLPVLIYHSIDDPLVPFANGVRLYKAALPPRIFQPTRGGHVQTFSEPVWRQVMLRFLDDPQRLSGLKRLVELPVEESSP